MLANAIFSDGSIEPLARFAEMFGDVMVQFDIFHAEYIDNYLRQGMLSVFSHPFIHY